MSSGKSVQQLSSDVGENYRILTTDEVIPYVLAIDSAREALGASEGETPDAFTCEEIGDGNLNLVFVVTRRQDLPRTVGGKKAVSAPTAHSASTGIVVKQALPYVRCIGESWPLPATRAKYEYLALVSEAKHAPEFVPKVFHFDEDLFTVTMEFLEEHIILRKGLIAGIRYPNVAQHLGVFLARNLFKTSDFGQPSKEQKKTIAEYAGNHAMCDLTHGVIFTDPFAGSDHNRHTSPQLDGDALHILQDTELKVAVCMLKWKFMSSAQALLHGDLHTGSVMVADRSTKVIDPEFAFVGPMGFDIGAIIANFLLAYFAHAGKGHPHADDGYALWTLEQAKMIWAHFACEFDRLWIKEHAGDLAPPAMFKGGSDVDRSSALTAFLTSVFSDTIGFVGVKMIRRIVGVAHVEDFESIEDLALRAKCESAALAAARELVLEAGSKIVAIEIASQVCRRVAKEHGLIYG